MGTSTNQSTSQLTSQAHELTKSFAVYDAEQRLTSIYTAPITAVTGSKCTRVDYTYINATSGLVEKMQENQDEWSAAYDQ